MRRYFEVARKTFTRIATYRQATLAGVFTNTVFGFVLAYVLLAVYQERETVGGFDATDAVTFTFVAQGLLMVVGITSSVVFWTVDSQEVGSAFTYGGHVATEYPLDVLGVWMRRIATFILPLAFVAYLRRLAC